MNTNSINNIVSVGNDIWYTVDSLSPQMFAMLGCIVAGYILKLFWRLCPKVNGLWIPTILILFVGPIIFWTLGCPTWEAVWDMRFPQVKQIIIGHLCGLGAWLIHQAVLRNSWIEKKLFWDREETQIPDGSHL